MSDSSASSPAGWSSRSWRPAQSVSAPGPDFFRFSDDEEFAAALRQQGLASPAVSAITFVQRFASADELWDGMLGATVRVAALITRQPVETRQRIRAAFDRLADGYRRGGGLQLSVAMKLATAQKPEVHARAIQRRGG